MQLSANVRNGMLEALEMVLNGQTPSAGTGSGGAITGTATQPKFQLWSGAMPSTTAGSPAGAKLVEFNMPADWANAASSGQKTLNGSWTGTGLAAASTGTTATFYRLVDSGGTCHEQGSVFMAVALSTSALTAVNGNVLTFSSTTGVQVGMNASGTGIVAGSTVLAVTSTTVTLSLASTAGVSSGAAITFNGDVTLDNTNVAQNQTVTVASKTYTGPNA